MPIFFQTKLKPVDVLQKKLEPVDFFEKCENTEPQAAEKRICAAADNKRSACMPEFITKNLKKKPIGNFFITF